MRLIRKSCRSWLTLNFKFERFVPLSGDVVRLTPVERLVSHVNVPNFQLAAVVQFAKVGVRQVEERHVVAQPHDRRRRDAGRQARQVRRVVLDHFDQFDLAEPVDVRRNCDGKVRRYGTDRELSMNTVFEVAYKE